MIRSTHAPTTPHVVIVAAERTTIGTARKSTLADMMAAEVAKPVVSAVIERSGDASDDRSFGSPSNLPNPYLGTVEKSPFYAVHVYRDDVGAAGGLLCDKHARVLPEDDSVIEGLYAAGNNTASPHGPTHPGPGASIGAGAVFGYIAATHPYSSP